MSYTCFELGANIVSKQGGDRLYAMCCAWATMVDYDKVVLLLGSQSDTGRNIGVGDLIGVSALAVGQAKIAATLGGEHSSTSEKVKRVDFVDFCGVKVIKGAKTVNAVKVLELLKPAGMEDECFVFGVILDHRDDEGKDFIRLKDLQDV